MSAHETLDAAIDQARGMVGSRIAMTDHASCPHADGVICAATLDDAAADPALTLEGAREMLRDAAAAIRHFHGLAPPALSDDWARTNVAAQHQEQTT